MASQQPNILAQILQEHQADILADWINEQKRASLRQKTLISEAELQVQSREFLIALVEATREGSTNIQTSEYETVRDFLSDLSRSRSIQGFPPPRPPRLCFR